MEELKNIMEGVSLVDGKWLLNNIYQIIGYGYSTLFWIYHWLNGMPLKERSSMLFDLVENKWVTIT